MLMSGLETYFLEVSAHASLKVATKASCRSKKIKKFSIFKARFLKQKRGSTTKKSEVSVTNLASLYLVQSYIFWK